MRILLAFVCLSLLLSGCVAGDSETGDGYIRFDGAGQETWTTEAKGCGTSNPVSVEKDGTGSVTITVKDSTGDEVLRETVGGTGATSRSFTASGIPGTWTLKASTSGDFAGDLDVEIDC